MLINAAKRWPKCVTTNLWPYGIRMANDVLNETLSFQDDQRSTPQQVFSGSKVLPNPKHWKPFRCQVYVLENSLQAGHIHHKWTQRTKVGIYLGQSRQHAQSVALVLDRNNGLVSPQFHLSFDPIFHTIKQDKLESMWQMKARFVTQREPSKPAKENSKRKKFANTGEHPQGHKRQRTALNGNERETPQDRANLQHRSDPLPPADNPDIR